MVIYMPFVDVHDDVIKWKQFPRHWLSVRGEHWSSVDFPHNDQCQGTLIFFFILRLNKLLSKESRCRRFQTPSPSIWRHCYATQATLSRGKTANQIIIGHRYYFSWEVMHLSIYSCSIACPLLSSELCSVWLYMTPWGTTIVTSNLQIFQRFYTQNDFESRYWTVC